MEDTETTVQERAAEASSWFETATRPDDSSFVRVKDGAPEWVTELVHTAHGDYFLPDDWRYSTIQDALEFIAENEDAEDLASEFADSAVDVYNGARAEWLASNLRRDGYCQEAVEEFGPEQDGSAFTLIGLGQYMEASEIFQLVLDALEEAVTA